MPAIILSFCSTRIVKEQSYEATRADDWQEVLDPVVDYFTAAVRLLFRADAAFAKPEIYEYLETRQIDYAIRLPANEVLQRKIATRPTEGPSPKPIVSYHDFTYQESWNVSRRVVAKVEWHQGELFPSGLHSYQPQLSNYRDSPTTAEARRSNG